MKMDDDLADIPEEDLLDLDDPKILKIRVAKRCERFTRMFRSVSRHLAAKQVGELRLNPHVLVNAVTSYFIDINRVKHFHMMTEGRADRSKVAGYTAKWIAKSRPIETIDGDEPSEVIHLINASFALVCACDMVKADPKKLPAKFLSELIYDLHYREIDGGIFAHLMLLIAVQWPKTQTSEKIWPKSQLYGTT